MTVNRLTHEVNKRILNLFSKDKWLFDKPAYRINTGIRTVDDLVDRLAKAEPHRYRRLKIVIRTVLQAVNQSRIPASLHIKAQNALGEKIKELIRDFSPKPAPGLQAQWA